MSTKLKIDDIEVICGTPEEAVQFIRIWRRNRAGVSLPTVPDIDSFRSGVSRPVRRRPVTTDLKIADRFLGAIAESGARGKPATSEEIMSALGVSHPKGIGSKAAIVNRVIADLGYSRREVYETERTPSGRIWRGAEKLHDALRDCGSRQGGM